MKFRNYSLHCLLATTLTLLTACGGGGGTIAGIGGTGITASGTITGFGSIFVNGVEYETGSANIVVDDTIVGEGDLQLGMVVTVTGTLDAGGTTGTATMVSFDDYVQGPVETVPVDPTGDGQQLEFGVLGVTVLADMTATVFDNGVTFATLVQGDYIEVSGFADAAGVLHATRIEGKGAFTAGLSEVELKGVAANVMGNTFDIGSIDVNTAGADLSGVPGGVVMAGMQVEVEGTLTGTTISASEVKENDDLPDGDLDKASIEGIVSDFVDNSSFRVAGQPVDASGASFDPPTLTLANDLEVEVEGPIVGGILQATEVEARGGDVKLEAAVQGVSQAASSITLQYATGTVTVLIDNQTSLRDDLGVFDPYTLGDVTATDFLEIQASLDGSGNLIATEIRRDTPEDDILEGPSTSCDGTSITLFGVSFTLLNGTTVFANENEQQVYADAAAFCADVNTRGLFVKVRDDAVADGIADEAELED